MLHETTAQARFHAKRSALAAEQLWPKRVRATIHCRLYGKVSALDLRLRLLQPNLREPGSFVLICLALHVIECQHSVYDFN